jgi:hypothetical protein
MTHSKITLHHLTVYQQLVLKHSLLVLHGCRSACKLLAMAGTMAHAGSYCSRYAVVSMLALLLAASASAAGNRTRMQGKRHSKIPASSIKYDRTITRPAACCLPVHVICQLQHPQIVIARPG